MAEELTTQVAVWSLCLLPTDVTGRQIGNIRRCQTMERLERQQIQLELDAPWDAKPVKAIQIILHAVSLHLHF